ncbi:MAG: hypothetical protein R2681_02290 [Pyrinomonadaceae bacterium]
MAGHKIVGIDSIVKRNPGPITIESIKRAHAERRDEISQRLLQFRDIWKFGTDQTLWEEMVYCFFTGGCSAKMGLNSIEAVREHLMEGSHEDVMNALVGKHRYPRARARYVIASRTFLEEHCGMRLREKLDGFGCPLERRDWLVKEKGIKGLGYKEASHYLRNIGFSGYAILDKHVLRCLAELKIIQDPKPPNTRSKYLTVENQLKKFADQVSIDFDEMDLVLWSMKTGEILK